MATFSFLVDADRQLQARPGAASGEALQRLQAAAPMVLPPDYLSMLEQCNGPEGDLAVEPGWVAIWPAETVLVNIQAYGFGRSLPDHFPFGTNGGGEVFVFRRSEGPASGVYCIPFIPLDPREALRVAATFEEFADAIGLPCHDG